MDRSLKTKYDFKIEKIINRDTSKWNKTSEFLYDSTLAILLIPFVFLYYFLILGEIIIFGIGGRK